MTDKLGDRMKHNYEEVSKTRLVRRMPVAVRVDGRSFHTFTRGFVKPFDDILIQSMQETMRKMCREIGGCVFAYQQSDEITFVLVDYASLETQAWFDNEVQKMASISASMATLFFNQAFSDAVSSAKAHAPGLDPKLQEVYDRAAVKGAMFDARVFNIPKEEVTNMVLWRQQDAMRNSVEMVARSQYSDRQLFRKNTDQMKQMLKEEKGIDWDALPVYKQRGSACIKEVCDTRTRWKVDLEMPILKGDGRKYLDDLIYVGV